MVRRRLIFFLAVLAILPALALVTGCKVVTGSGETVTWQMDYTDFARLDVGSAFTLKVTRADKFAVTITIDKNLNEYLSVHQRGDTLSIGLEAHNTYTNTTQSAVITMPDLRRLELSGAATATVSGFSTTKSVDYELSGGSSLELADVRSGDTGLKLSGGSNAAGGLVMVAGNFDLSGGSSLDIKGSAGDITIDGSSGSQFSLADFPVNDAGISLSGGSSAVVNLSGRMDLDLSGGSRVEYIGNPKLGSINMSGGSTVNQRK